jgi:hypothetical protein
MLSETQIFEVQRYRRKKYKHCDICKLVGISEQALLDFLADQKLKKERGQLAREIDPTPEEIEAMIAPMREAQRRNPRYENGTGRVSDLLRMPRHYANVPAELR